MVKKTLKLTPPIFYYHSRGRGPYAYRTFVREADRRTKAFGCRLSTEVGQMGDLVAVIACPTRDKLRVMEKDVRSIARSAARLQGTRR